MKDKSHYTPKNPHKNASYARLVESNRDLIIEHNPQNYDEMGKRKQLEPLHTLEDAAECIEGVTWFLRQQADCHVLNLDKSERLDPAAAMEVFEDHLIDARARLDVAQRILADLPDHDEDGAPLVTVANELKAAYDYCHSNSTSFPRGPIERAMECIIDLDRLAAALRAAVHKTFDARQDLVDEQTRRPNYSPTANQESVETRTPPEGVDPSESVTLTWEYVDDKLSLDVRVDGAFVAQLEFSIHEKQGCFMQRLLEAWPNGVGMKEVLAQVYEVSFGTASDDDPERARQLGYAIRKKFTKDGVPEDVLKPFCKHKEGYGDARVNARSVQRKDDVTRFHGDELTGLGDDEGGNDKFQAWSDAQRYRDWERAQRDA